MRVGDAHPIRSEEVGVESSKFKFETNSLELI